MQPPTDMDADGNPLRGLPVPLYGRPTVPAVIINNTDWFNSLVRFRGSKLEPLHMSLVSEAEKEAGFEAKTRHCVVVIMVLVEETEDEHMANIATLSMMTRNVQTAFHDTGPIRWSLSSEQSKDGKEMYLNLVAYRPKGIALDGTPIPAQ